MIRATLIEFFANSGIIMVTPEHVYKALFRDRAGLDHAFGMGHLVHDPNGLREQQDHDQPRQNAVRKF